MIKKEINKKKQNKGKEIEVDQLDDTSVFKKWEERP